MAFEKIRAQLQAKNILQGIVQTEKVANAYIFTGPAQSGKTTAAKEFWLELNRKSTEKFNENNSIDFYQLKYENSIKIEQIRDLKSYVQYGPHQANYLMVVIPQAERLTTEAANSFLKLLEEPPARVIFVLETMAPESLPRTIISRCQKINFSQLPDTDLRELLTAEFPAGSPATLEAAVQLSGGLLSQARLYIQEQEKVNNILDFCSAIKNKPFGEISDFVEDLGSNKESVINQLQLVLQNLRNQYNVTQARVLEDFLDILRKNVNLRLTLEVMFMKLRDCE